MALTLTPASPIGGVSESNKRPNLIAALENVYTEDTQADFAAGTLYQATALAAGSLSLANQATADITGSKTYYDGGHYSSDVGSRAFDDSESTQFQGDGAPDWVAVDLGAGNAIAAAKLRMKSQYYGSTAQLKDFILQGANDSTNGSDGAWTDVYTGLFANNSSWQDFAITGGGTAYRWYRIYVTSSYRTGFTGASVIEAEIIPANYYLTGKRTSAPVALSGACPDPVYTISWTATAPTGTAVAVKCAINTDPNTMPADGSFAAATSGGGIPGLTANEDLTGKYLWIREELATDSAAYTPTLDSLATNVPDTRSYSVFFEIDLSSGFDSPRLQSGVTNSPPGNVSWQVPADLTSRKWYWRASCSGVVSSVSSFVGSYGISKRTLSHYENIGKLNTWTKKRILALYENIGKLDVWTKKRALYQYENITADPPFPFIYYLSTTRASQGGAVTIYGNGFGAKYESDPANADRAARGYGGEVYLGTQLCGIVSWSWQQITFTVPADAVSGAVFVRLTTPDPPGSRDSNLKGLEIYEAPPTTDTGLELFVFAKDSPNTILAELDGAVEKSFYMQRNACGSGKFRISRLDPKGGDRDLITDQNYILCRLNGIDVFKWVIESRRPVYVDDSEEQWIEVSGRGNMTVLDDAIVYPEAMPSPPTLERTWAQAHGAAIFLQLFNEAQARGCFPFVTCDFTAGHDSLGMPWDDLTDVSFHTGAKLSSVAEKLTSSFGLFDLYMTPTFILRAYKSPGRGADLSDTVRFFKGQSILSHENQSDSANIENIVLVEGEAGSVVEVTHTITDSVTAFGRREGYLQARNIPDDWTQLANYGLMKANKSGVVNWGIRMATDFAFHKPFDTYDMGDWIWVHIEPEGADTIGFDGKVRVVGVTVTEDADLKLSAQLELNNIMLEREIYLAQLVERLSMDSTDSQMTNPSETPPAGIAHNHFHGLLLGLEDDTHPQYYNALRHAGDLHDFLARVTSIKRQGSDDITGAVTLIPGSGVSMTQNTEAKTITVSSTGGSGGAGYENLIDVPPGSPNAMDDEFNGEALDGKWTIWNQQTGQTVTVQNGHLVMNTPTTIKQRVFAVMQPISGSAWKIRSKFAFDCATWNYFAAGLVVRRTTGNDRSTVCGLMYHSSYGWPTVWYGRMSGVNLSGEGDLYNLSTGKNYWELEYDGTNLIWRISVSGAAFCRAWQETDAAWLGGAPEQVGIWLHPYSNDGSAWWGGQASMDWFRRVS